MGFLFVHEVPIWSHQRGRGNCREDWRGAADTASAIAAQPPLDRVTNDAGRILLILSPASCIGFEYVSLRGKRQYLIRIYVNN